MTRNRQPMRPRLQSIEDAQRMKELIANGYTVADASRHLGIGPGRGRQIARAFGIKALQGAVSEARSEAAIKGNAVRWGT